MALTAEQAYQQISAEISRRGQFNIGNVLDSVIGVAAANTDELQAMLNELMKKKGILNENDEKAIQDLLERQGIEKRNRQKIRTANTFFLIGTGVLVTGLIYLTIKKLKK